MALLPPLEVTKKEHRRWAWPLFIMLVVAFVVYVAVSFVLAAKSRDHPSISQQYRIEDWATPDFYVTSQAFLSPFNDAIILQNIAATCGLSTDHVAGPFQNISAGTQAPLNWDPLRSNGEETFHYDEDSNCEVSTFVRNDSTDAGRRLQFVFHTSGFKVPKNKIQLPSVFLTAAVYWTYVTDVTNQTVVPPFLRSGRIIGLFSPEQYDNPFSISTVETGVQYSAEITTTIFNYLNGATRLVGQTITSRIPSSSGDPFPLQDWVRVSLSLNTIGSLYVKEENPVNPTVLASQVFSAWAFVMLVFSAIYSFEQERSFALSGLISRVKKMVKSARAPRKLEERPETRDGPILAERIPADSVELEP